jgi:hypothetical protein
MKQIDFWRIYISVTPFDIVRLYLAQLFYKLIYPKNLFQAQATIINRS